MKLTSAQFPNDCSTEQRMCCQYFLYYTDFSVTGAYSLSVLVGVCSVNKSYKLLEGASELPPPSSPVSCHTSDT